MMTSLLWRHLTIERCPFLHIVSNGHNSATGQLIDFVFGSKLGFSVTADRTAPLPVGPNPRWRLAAILKKSNGHLWNASSNNNRYSNITLVPVFSIVRHFPSSVQSRMTSEPVALIWNDFLPFVKFDTCVFAGDIDFTASLLTEHVIVRISYRSP